MSLNSKLQALKSVLSGILNKANSILIEKGKEPANNIDMALNDIASLPSGDDTLLRIALAAPTDEEIGTVDLKLDSSWGNLRNNAFYNSTKLKTVDLSDCANMTEIPSGCFSGCSNVENVALPPNIKRLNGLSGTKITTIDIPASVEKMGGSVFTNCSNLTEINFPTDSKVNEISTYAFQSCKKLGDIYFPPLLKNLGERVLYMTNEKAKKVYFQSVPTSVSSVAFSTTKVTDIYLPCSEDVAPTGHPWSSGASMHFDWKAFKHIEVAVLPEKTFYFQGELFDPTGMKVKVFDENYGADGNLGEMIASDELGFDDLEYSREPLLFSNGEVPFYIYYTDKYNVRHIADVTITVALT